LHVNTNKGKRKKDSKGKISWAKRVISGLWKRETGGTGRKKHFVIKPTAKEKSWSQRLGKRSSPVEEYVCENGEKRRVGHKNTGE